MPTISKVRIVNFWFNNGKRLIPDIIMDMSDESRKGIDTLITLVNRGGKTAMTQLLLAPIHPKAKVNRRNLEVYFSRPEDHCFVLLEWQKDNSREKLLTGIAVSSARTDKNSSDEDAVQSNKIKYYTFCAEYLPGTKRFDILQMELSRMEKGKFVPADYEYVKKTFRGDVEIFDMYDTVRWRSKLSEYGIYQDEFRKVLEPLNSTEGGMKQFFADMKTSDDVINKMMIPAIEMKFVGGKGYDRLSDDKLDELFYKYVSQYAEKEKMIEEGKRCESFISNTGILLEKLGALNDACKKLNHCLSVVFGLKHGTERSIAETEKDIEGFESELSAIDESLKRIEYELASKNYYDAKCAYESAVTAYENVVSEKNNAAQELQNKRMELRIQLAAKYAERCSEEDRLITVLSGQIDEISGGKERDLLHDTGKKAFMAVAGAKTRNECSIRECERKKEQLSLQKETAQEKLRIAVSEKKKAEKQKIEQVVLLSAAQKETDRLITELNITAQRNLMQHYDEKKIEAAQIKHQKQLEELSKKQSASEEKIHKLEERRNDIPGLKYDLKEKTDSNREKYTDIQKAIEIYSDLEAQIQLICQEHSMGFEHRFSDLLKRHLEEQIAFEKGRAEQVRMKIYFISKEMDSFRNHTVHIPEEIITFLNSSGVEYITVEEYLLTQIDRQTMMVEDCLLLLDKYPFLAFSIIISQEQQEILFDQKADWLPGVLPLLTNEDLYSLMKGNYQAADMLACYSELYFKDRKEYADALTDKKAESEHELELIQNRLEEMEKQLEIVSIFNYDPDWLSDMEARQRALEAEYDELEKKRCNLDEENKRLTDEIKTTKESLEVIEQMIRSCEQWMKDYQKLLERYSEEKRLSKEKTNAEKAYVQAEIKYTEAQETYDRLISELDEADHYFRELSDSRKEITAAYEQIREYSCDEVSDEDWRGLLSSYNALFSTMNSDINSLKQQIDAAGKRRAQYQKELEKQDCPPELYQGVVYSESTEDSLTGCISQMEHTLSVLNESVSQSSGEKGRKEALLQTSFESVRKYGEPLPLSEIYADFEKRQQQALYEKDEVEELLSELREKKQLMTDVHKDILRDIAGIKAPPKLQDIVIEESITEQWSTIRKEYKEAVDLLSKNKDSFERCNRQLLQMYSGFAMEDVFRGIDDLPEHTADTEDYCRTAGIQLEAAVHAAQISLKQINDDIADFKNTKEFIISQCVIQGKSIYEGLLQIQKNSFVKIYADEKPKQMIRFNIPDKIDENSSRLRIENEINKWTDEMLAKMKSDNTEATLRRYVSAAVSSAVLVRKYIGADSIQMKAYKADIDPRNSEYRSWKHTGNSGAEGFLIYLAVILSVMNYSRNNNGVFKNNTGVLILDNPFGEISTKDALVPMFEMAKRANVQLICFSDITKCDITSCFSNIVKASVKSSKFSSMSLISVENQEAINTAFYKSEQLALF